jgi:hypothetical protein
MRSGLRALVAAAGEEPLPFTVSLYCGSMFVTGRIAPDGWFYDVTAKGYGEEVWEALRRVRREEERQQLFHEHNEPVARLLDAARDREAAAEADEVTLVDVEVYPAVGTQGTRSGGQSLPVARIPLAAVNAWWVISGETIRGRAGANVGWGFLFPIGN